jgi:hypothetical protein
MDTSFRTARSVSVGRLLCLVVLFVLVVALIYAGWVGIHNYARIHV